MRGWIKLQRDFLQWEWFTQAEVMQVYMYLLLSANHVEQKWRGITINRGEIVTSIARISQMTELSAQTVRTCLAKLKSTGEITSVSTNKYTIITLCKYDTYEDFDNEINNQPNNQPNNQTNNQPTSEQQSNNNQITTNKNDKNIENDNNITHTEYINLVKYFSGACAARTRNEAEELSTAAMRVIGYIRTTEAGRRVFNELDSPTRGMIWLWGLYSHLQMVFTHPLDKRELSELQLRYEQEDIERIIEAMANKIAASKPLYSFFLTFKEWAARDHVIANKARLGNPRYNIA